MINQSITRLSDKELADLIALIKVNKSYSLLLLPFGRNNCMNEKEGRDGWKKIFNIKEELERMES